MALLRAPFFYYPTPFPPFPLKQRSSPHFAPHAISRSAACSQKAAPPCYSISDFRDGIAWWDLYNRIFFPVQRAAWAVPCTCCCQWALQGPQEVWQQIRAPQGDSGFICILLQEWWYQFWATSFAHPAISAVPHRDVIKSSSADNTKSCLNFLLLGQKHCWRP